MSVVVGTLGDGGKTIEALRKEHGFGPRSVDLVFIDHDKSVYLSDLRLILGQGWLRRGALVVADNVKFPGAPGVSRVHERKPGQELAHGRA